MVLLMLLFSDPAGTLCHRALKPPRGSVQEPQCELSSFQPQTSPLGWVAPLTESATSPAYLQADWLSVSNQGFNRQLVISSLMRSAAASEEHDGDD